ncbi:retrovirus-related Pol polyprotein from transposon 17.6 [Trichonephila clavipes]|nr:retrovirus-related Pol polyprotein from transposon 17.6 [Trichonephila clavipes]
MDGIINPSSDELDGLNRLTRVLKPASEYGLELNLIFLKSKSEFLGHTIEKGTIKPSLDKTKAVQNFPDPKNVKQVQSFLGLPGYFRKFIQNYSIIAKPLRDLLRDNAVFHFGPDQQLAFQTLRQKLSENPVLHIFKLGAKLELHTDAKKFGYGAILLQQTDDSKLHPVHYFIKKTIPQEEKYSSYELEVLAVIESLKKFRNYLVGNKFKIVTDCSAFQKTVSKKQLTPKIARWASFLEDFNYEIIHRTGKQMRHSTSSRNALEKLKQQEITFGNPRRIITDKGTAFTSEELREYCENENIQHLSITTGITRGNGQIEQIHSSLIPILSKLSIDDASKWYKFVSVVQRTLNSTISRSTQMTPFQLLTGVKMMTKQDLEILKLLEEEIVETFTENREKIREEAKRNILKMQEENCRNFNKKRKKAYQYEIGDIVVNQRTQFGTGLKLRPKFFGPYEVVKVKPKDRYDVRKIGLHEGPNATSTAADPMKMW